MAQADDGPVDPFKLGQFAEAMEGLTEEEKRERAAAILRVDERLARWQRMMEDCIADVERLETRIKGILSQIDDL